MEWMEMSRSGRNIHRKPEGASAVQDSQSGTHNEDAGTAALDESVVNSPDDSFTARLRYLFASRLRADGSRWTLNAVARATAGRLSTQQVYALYSGQSANPTLETLCALADVFGVAPDFFVRGDALAEAQRQNEHAYSTLIADPQVAFVSRRMGQMSPADKALIAEFVRRLSVSAVHGSPLPDQQLQEPLTPEMRQDLPHDFPRDAPQRKRRRTT
jgi:transcriptional regulator with XRE-family HTH domain